MNFDEIVVKESPGICRCCLSEGCYKDLGAEYTWMNETEVYADMLLDCFDIGITQHNDGPNGAKRLICEVCITRLRDACNFKKQVVDCEKRFIDMLARGEFRPKVLLYQPQSSMKEESLDETAEDVLAADIEYLEDMDYVPDDEEIKTEAHQSTSAATTSSELRSRGRPKKEEDRPDKVKKQKVTKDDKPGQNVVAQVVPIQQRRLNLQILFNNTTIVPFKRRTHCWCFFCSKSHKDRLELVAHNQTHLPCSTKDKPLKELKGIDFEIMIDVSEMQCKICSEDFQNIEILAFHLVRKHKLPYNTNAKVKFAQYRLVDFKCVLCHQDYKKLQDVIKHTYKEHSVDYYECDHCGKRLRTKKLLRAHLKNYHKDVYACQNCSKTFQTRHEYMKHNSNDHVFHCSLCLKSFGSAKNALRHLLTEHDTAHGGTCSFCDKKLDSRLELLSHSRVCSKRPVEADEMEISTSSHCIAQREAKQFVRNAVAYLFNNTTLLPFKVFHNRFRCFYCEEEYSCCNDLRNHTNIEHKICDVKLKSMKLKGLGRKFWIKVDSSLLRCKFCDNQSLDLQSLVDHLETEHGAKLGNCSGYFHPFKLINGKHACPQCGLEFAHFPHLLIHFNKEHATERHLCGFCGESFHNMTSLQLHTSRKHTTADRYKCSQCQLGFHTQGLLMKHQGSAHKSKVFKCVNCDEMFTNEYLRRRHVIKKHGGGHRCKCCGVSFITHYKMMCHIKRLHLMEKNVKCSYCDKAFYNNARLKMHMAVHTGHEAYKCDYCEKTFSWKKGLVQHVKMHYDDSDVREEKDRKKQ